MSRFIFLHLLSVISFYSSAEDKKTDVNSSLIPFKQEPESIQNAPTDALIALMLVLGFCIGILFLLRRFLRKKGVVPQPLAGDRILVLSNKRILSGMTATLLAVDDKEYLVVNNGEQLSVIEHSVESGKGNSQDA